MAQRGNRPKHVAGVSENENEAIDSIPAEDTLEDDFRTERVPGPGPRDTDAGRATTKQLETHDLKSSR